MIQGILLEEGIRSVLQRMRGFDVPDFLAVGHHGPAVGSPSRRYAA